MNKKKYSRKQKNRLIPNDVVKEDTTPMSEFDYDRYVAILAATKRTTTIVTIALIVVLILLLYLFYQYTMLSINYTWLLIRYNDNKMDIEYFVHIISNY